MVLQAANGLSRNACVGERSEDILERAAFGRAFRPGLLRALRARLAQIRPARAASEAAARQQQIERGAQQSGRDAQRGLLLITSRL